MKPSGTTFTTLYTDWLHTVMSMLPGGSTAASAAAEELTPKQEQVIAHQEWEDEGGCIKPPERSSAQTLPAPGPKIPL